MLPLIPFIYSNYLIIKKYIAHAHVQSGLVNLKRNRPIFNYSLTLSNVQQADKQTNQIATCTTVSIQKPSK